MKKKTNKILTLNFTKDQAEYLKSVIPKSYTLLPLKTKGRTDMTIQDLIDFEKGGSYNDYITNCNDPVDCENQKECSTEGYDHTSVGDNPDEDLLLKEIMCKIETDLNQPTDPRLKEQPKHQPKKVMYQERNPSEKLSNQLIQAQPELVKLYTQNQNLQKKQFQAVELQHCVANSSSNLGNDDSIEKNNNICRNSSLSQIQQLPDWSQKHHVPQNIVSDQQKYYLCILGQIKENKQCDIFSRPLSAAQLQNLGRNLVLQTQIDLKTIQRNVLQNIYQNSQQFQRDLLLFWLRSYSFKLSGFEAPIHMPNQINQSSKLCAIQQQLPAQFHQLEDAGDIQEQESIIQETAYNLPAVISKSQKILLCQQISCLSRKHLIEVLLLVSPVVSEEEVIFDIQTLSDQKILQIKQFIARVKHQNQKTMDQEL